jgi:AraC-like DNA-binding protein
MTPDTLERFCDPLGEALHQLRMSGVFYCQSELTAPWGAHLPAMSGCLLIHLVTRGRCWLSTDSGESSGRWLQAGDFALVPHGLGHSVQSDPQAPTPDLFDLPRERVSERFEILRSDGGGEPTQMVCAAVRLDHPVAPQLLSALPPVICIEAAGLTADDWLPSLLRLMADEARQMRAGGEAVITRLADILVIQAIRHWVQHDATAQSGWLGALKDKRIGRSMALIHRDPAKDWTVATLAQASSMSRSAFAQRFTALVGVPAMEYLTSWRMNLAQAWLSQGLSMADVAARTGYQSDVAFARAFKRVQGSTPGRLRLQARRKEAEAEISA